MANVDSIVQIISTIGFPITVCLIAFWYIYQMQKDHKAEMSSMSEALNNNTLVMQKLIDKLDGELGGKHLDELA